MTVFPCFIRRNAPSAATSGIYLANGDERSMTTMISNPGARGSLCFIAHHRVLPGLRLPFFLFPLSNYVIPTREPHSSTRRVNLKKKKNTHVRGKRSLVPANQASVPIYRDASETFSGIILGYDLSRICLRIGCYPISCAILYVYVGYCAPTP